MPQNTGRTANGQWLPGQSGNAGGRPLSAGFADRVRKATNDGQDVIQFALDVRAGLVKDEVITKEGGVVKVLPPVKVRLDANTFLADRGWGKTPLVLPASSELEGKSDEEVAEQLWDVFPDSLKARLAKRFQVAQGAH